MYRLILLIMTVYLLGGGMTPSIAQFEITIPSVEPKDRICFALYTIQDNILNMTVQLYPLQPDESRLANLHIQKDNQWTHVATTQITQHPYGNKAKDSTWTAHFRIKEWDMSRDWPYRITALEGKAQYGGLIRHDPVEQNEIVVAAFTGNSIYERDGGDIPRTDIVENIKRLDPDLLFFSGDQVYDHTRHLAYWLRFGRDFADIVRNRPVITIPDDHDVGQGNLWGASGRQSKTPAGHDGGYYMPARYVKAVERAQTWHLPDPYDPTPVNQGIGVYYTDLTLGRIGFAIIEDRKFKSGPEGRVPPQSTRPDLIIDPSYDPAALDVDGAVLLGDRQLRFLHDWGQDWQGTDMKAVLSQTIFCGGAHVIGKYGRRIQADLDSNGWPQTGRNKALAELRRCFAVHIAGDQHLATLFHHGIDDWEDACFSFCVPSIANLYLRWWDPLTPGENRKPGMPDYTGRHRDGLGNRVTCWAAANPAKEPNGGNKLTTRAAGFGVIRFNKPTRMITFECWPRNVDITDPNANQYPGWPKSIHQTENYGRTPTAYLPTLVIQGSTHPVVRVVDDSDETTVYTLRIQGNTFTPPVFKQGTYTLYIGEGKNIKILKNVATVTSKGDKTTRITL